MNREPDTVFGYVIMNILRDGSCPLTCSYSHLPQLSITNQPAFHPPSPITARPASFFLKTSWSYEWRERELCVCVCVWTLEMNGSVFLTGAWIQCVSPNRQASSFTHCFSTFPNHVFVTLLWIQACAEKHTHGSTQTTTQTEGPPRIPYYNGAISKKYLHTVFHMLLKTFLNVNTDMFWCVSTLWFKG